MKDLYTLAEKFAAKISQPSNSVVKIAGGRKHRKQLEKDLSYIKDCYNRQRSSLSMNEKTHADLSAAIDKERKEVARRREEIMRFYDVLRNMDLNDVSEVRFHSSGDVGYVKNNRLFKLDESGSLVPYKRKKDIDNVADYDQSDPLNDEDDDSFDADDLLNSLL